MNTNEATKERSSDHIEKADLAPAECHDSWQARNKALVRKIDFTLIPALAVIYAFSLIDRGNLPNARLAGMDTALGISIGNRYSILNMMFFVPYIIFEIPANLVIRKIGPVTWLGSISLAWGIVTIGMGFTKTWGELLVCRVIFGALEAGMFPGCLYLLSCWYTRFEVQKRFSAFYCLGVFSNGISSLLAYGIQQMDGLGGLGGWSWIFIIEGISSCIAAVFAILLLVDFPDKADKPRIFRKHGFLTSDEVVLALDRITRDRGDAVPEKLTWSMIVKHSQDWKIWEFALLVCFNNAVMYSFTLFLPIILRQGLGYSLGVTYALIVPPSIAGIIWMFITGWLADKTHKRGPMIIFNSCWIIIGVAMMAFATNPKARYAGVFFGLAATVSNTPAVLSYQHNNTVGQLKRAFGTALLTAGGGIGGVMASNVFRQQDAPNYRPGLIFAIAAQAATILLVAKNMFLFSRQNAKADRGQLVIEGAEGFRYTY